MLSKKKKIILVILIAVALNVITFCVAYPETFKPESSTLARDFSAYYIGEWRLFHNPTKIYAGGAYPGDYQILPQPQTFKYTPSFLILFAPFLALSYQNALTAFDIVQLALIPALAFFVYKIVKDKNLVLGAIVAVIVLIDPSAFSLDKFCCGQLTQLPSIQLKCPVFLSKLLLRICPSKCPHTPNRPPSRRIVP